MNIKTFIKKLIKLLIPQKHITAKIYCLTPNERLKGKRILITGGGRGLGAAMAKKFKEEGASVLICGRDEQKLKDTAGKIGCMYMPIDIKNCDYFSEFIQKADEKLGGINILVNNAGISLHEGNIRNVSQTQFDNQINTNLRGSYFMAQKFVELIEQKNRTNANILFISSERGDYVDDLPYGLTKVAINSLTKGLAYRLIKKGIRVNAIAPGVTTSDMTGFSDENLYASYNANERVYLPEEVAEVACFILSDASKCISGQVIVCNEAKSINVHWK